MTIAGWLRSRVSTWTCSLLTTPLGRDRTNGPDVPLPDSSSTTCCELVYAAKPSTLTGPSSTCVFVPVSARLYCVSERAGSSDCVVKSPYRIDDWPLSTRTYRRLVDCASKPLTDESP